MQSAWWRIFYGMGHAEWFRIVHSIPGHSATIWKIRRTGVYPLPFHRYGDSSPVFHGIVDSIQHAVPSLPVSYSIDFLYIVELFNRYLVLYSSISVGVQTRVAAFITSILKKESLDAGPVRGIRHCRPPYPVGTSTAVSRSYGFTYGWRPILPAVLSVYVVAQRQHS